MNEPTNSAPVIAIPAEPLDAYRALQLMPSAHHDLIEQAYWVLVGRTRARGGHAARLGRLNDAYATLINPERREAYDLEHGLAKLRTRPKVEMPKRPMFGRTPRFTTRLTHYQLLDVDFEALPEVVDTAYVFHKAILRRSDPKAVYMRALLEDAYATLSNAPRRAQYDEKVAPRTRTAPGEQALPPATPAVAPLREPAPLFPEPSSSHGAQALSPASPPASPAVPEHLATPPVSSPHGAQALPPAASSALSPATSPALPPAASPSETHGLGGWLRSHIAPRDGDNAPRMDKRTQRVLRAEARLDVIEAEHRRLAELGLLGDRPPAPTGGGEPELPGRPQFRFTDGPQAGEAITLAENSLILGASDAADVVLRNPDGMIGAGHVRVWRRDGEYILHQLDSFSTTYVNGERLDLRLAILEPGDEIRIGPHTLIFDQAPVEAAPAPTP